MSSAAPNTTELHSYEASGLLTTSNQNKSTTCIKLAALCECVVLETIHEARDRKQSGETRRIASICLWTDVQLCPSGSVQWKDPELPKGRIGVVEWNEFGEDQRRSIRRLGNSRDGKLVCIWVEVQRWQVSYLSYFRPLLGGCNFRSMQKEQRKGIQMEKAQTSLHAALSLQVPPITYIRSPLLKEKTQFTNCKNNRHWNYETASSCSRKSHVCVWLIQKVPSIRVFEANESHHANVHPIQDWPRENSHMSLPTFAEPSSSRRPFQPPNRYTEFCIMHYRQSSTSSHTLPEMTMVPYLGSK